MKTLYSEGIGKLFSLPVLVPLFLFVGCATAPQPVAPPVPPKPEISEAVSAVQKAAEEIAPAAPAAPSPPPAPPAIPAAPPAPAPSAEPPAAEPAQDPIATGAVLLNPSVPDDAKTIQSRLAELGFYKMAIDGIWGRGSRTALRAYKVKNNLKKDDQWDEKTQMALFSKGGAPAQPVDASDPIASGAVLLDPSASQDAQTIQGRLAELGFYRGAIDGIWGAGSRAALRTFKEKSSLPNPEKWDKETQMLLFRSGGK